MNVKVKQKLNRDVISFMVLWGFLFQYMIVAETNSKKNC